MRQADALVVGSGPNGLAAALTLARAGLLVDVYEGADTPGGGCRTEELTLPGFRHDICSSVHPLLAASPFFQRTDLAARGARLLHPAVCFAHPLDGGRAGSVVRSVDATAAGLGADARPYRRLFEPLVAASAAIVPGALSPLRTIPAHPVALARFAAVGLLPANRVVRRFATDEARALLAGAAAHSMLPLNAPLTGAFGVLLTLLAHSVGWPVVEGGSSGIAEALVGELESLGGQVLTGQWIRSLGDLPPARAVLLDVSPRSLLALAGDRLRPREQRGLERFRYGSGVYKMDWALDGPVPWTAEACRHAGTVHVGGTWAEVASSEAEVSAGRHPDRPFCIVVQASVADASRAPAGKHTLWGYCHVPSGSSVDMSDRIEGQIERFAPGFRALIRHRVAKTAGQMQQGNPNYVGGDINGGAATLRQTIFRPTFTWNPYRTTLSGVYLCSASTPPGGGVHGMCGDWAARQALADLDLD